MPEISKSKILAGRKAVEVKHETCLEYFRRRLSEGWKIISQIGFNVILQSPEGIIDFIDLRNDLVTYYWNSFDAFGLWANPPNAVDGDIDTDATCTELSDQTLELDATNAPGTDLGTITKREYRIYGLSSNAQLMSIRLQGQLVGSNLTISPEGWSSYYDVTAIGGLAWADLPDAFNEFTYNAIGGSPSFQVSRVELRITYTPPPLPVADGNLIGIAIIKKS